MKFNQLAEKKNLLKFIFEIYVEMRRAQNLIENGYFDGAEGAFHEIQDAIEKFRGRLRSASNRLEVTNGKL